MNVREMLAALRQVGVDVDAVPADIGTGGAPGMAESRLLEAVSTESAEAVAAVPEIFFVPAAWRNVPWGRDAQGRAPWEVPPVVDSRSLSERRAAELEWCRRAFMSSPSDA